MSKPKGIVVVLDTTLARMVPLKWLKALTKGINDILLKLIEKCSFGVEIKVDLTKPLLLYLLIKTVPEISTSVYRLLLLLLK